VIAQDKKVVVIGSGLGGLAAACVTAARGYQVTVVEKNSWIGGKAAVLEQDGFRFDMGPTILTVPSVLKRIFSEAGKEMSDYLDLIPLDPQWRCFFSDQTRLDLVADLERMKSKLSDFSNLSQVAEGYEKFMKISERLHTVSDRFFFWKNVGSISDTLDMRNTFNLSVLGDLLSLRMGRTVAGTVRSCVKDHRVAQMIDHFTQYVGSSPAASPAVLCGIANMQTEEGIWYPVGGTRAVPLALEKLAKELGVEFITGKHVDQICENGGQVNGVQLVSGEHLPASAVISNSDSVRMHRELLNEKIARKFLKRRKYEPACSGVVLYLGLKEKYDQLLHHNFVFSKDPEIEFDEIYRQGIPAADPSCYVCAPSCSEPSVAPDGGESLYILVHTPYLRKNHQWTKMLPDYRKTILQKLADTAGMHDIESRIVTENVLTPQDIQDRYHVLDGAIYGLASHGRFFGAFKPGNRSLDVDGLYLAGGSAHPGPGMPMVMMSGWIAADTLDQDFMSN
jgi:diapolycopene oxygenase